MLSVTLQPYTYKRISSVNDLKSLAVLKFSHKAIMDDDFTFAVEYDCEMREIEDKKELFNLLVKSACKGNIITYNSNLLFNTLNALANYCGEKVPDEVFEKVPDLMKKFAKLHNNGRWAKLEDALQYYDHTLSVDTSNPYDMSEKTIILYRLMQEANDL